MKTCRVLLLVALILTALCTYAGENNTDACDCNTIVLSDEEIQNGCTASVKEQTCSLYRLSMWRKEQLMKEQELRKLEKRMEPRYNKP